MKILTTTNISLILPLLLIISIHSLYSNCSLLIIPNFHHCLHPCMKKTLLAFIWFLIILLVVMIVFVFLLVVIECYLGFYFDFYLGQLFLDSHFYLRKHKTNSILLSTQFILSIISTSIWCKRLLIWNLIHFLSSVESSCTKWRFCRCCPSRS